MTDPISNEVLAFGTLREANEARQKDWCPDQLPDLSFRGNELAGETGEVCNVIKKLERERLGWRGTRDTVQHLAEELGDVVICTDLIAISAGIDLDAAVQAKFNATSEKVGLPHRLSHRQSPAGVRVKPLEWGDAMHGGWVALGAAGLYHVHVGFSDEKPFWFFASPFDHEPNEFASPEDAKAAAQADYERRILSCLVSHALAPGDTQDPLLSTGETQEPAGAEPVGEAGAMPGSNGGFTMAAFEASRVPIGTKLYASPPEDVAITDEWLRDTAMNVMLATEVEEAIRILTAALSSEARNG